MTLAIRRALAADVPEIARIYNQAVLERIASADTELKSLDDRLAWFGQFDDGHPIWIGEEDGRVACYGGLLKYSSKDGYRFAAENTVYVARETRGRGHGRTMLEHLIAEAKRLGLRYILAKIFTHNEVSLKLHAQQGFRELGLQRRVIEMDGRWYDVTLMDLNL
jgi:L-amino acid N-acyltransferase